jgi:N-acetylmuramoyl-L-alanine amidase
MGIQYGKVAGVAFDQAKWSGGQIEPSLVVLHDTASSLTPGSAANYLRDNEAKVSVHFVIELDGNIVQQVRTDHKAYHAGTSEYHGRKWCNGFSIGIELVNPGRMTRASDTYARTWYGAKLDISQHGIEEAATPEHGRGLWMPYPEAQITSLLWLLQTLFSSIPALEDITTHWYISPGRKVDTNPLFPLEHIRSRILGRDDPAEKELEERAVRAASEEMAVVTVPGGALNMRKWPSFNPNIITQIPDGTPVPVIAEGNFSGQQWLKVFYGGAVGWIVKRYADPVTFSTPGFNGGSK